MKDEVNFYYMGFDEVRAKYFPQFERVLINTRWEDKSEVLFNSVISALFVLDKKKEELGQRRKTTEEKLRLCKALQPFYSKFSPLEIRLNGEDISWLGITGYIIREKPLSEERKRLLSEYGGTPIAEVVKNQLEEAFHDSFDLVDWDGFQDWIDNWVEYEHGKVGCTKQPQELGFKAIEITANRIEEKLKELQAPKKAGRPIKIEQRAICQCFDAKGVADYRVVYKVLNLFGYGQEDFSNTTSSPEAYVKSIYMNMKKA